MENTFEMNVYDNDRYSETVTCNVLHMDQHSELRVVECNDIFYVVDCEGDAQARCGVGPSLQSARHAFTLFDMIMLESLYFGIND